MTVDDVNDGHTTRLHNYTDIRKPLPCHKECVPTVRTDYR
jgi:hypothetical protein